MTPLESLPLFGSMFQRTAPHKPVDTPVPTVLIPPASHAPDTRTRGAVQTLRLNRVEVFALKDAKIARNISGQDIMLRAIRVDLGLPPERQPSEGA